VRLPWLLSWWREGVVGPVRLMSAKAYPSYTMAMSGIGLVEAGRRSSILLPLLPYLTRFPPRSADDRLLATGPGSRLGLLGLPSPMRLAVQ
jgi:hypothetical protein